ncbi:M23 family metallopeptidase [Lacinutrix venerupis]|uniref:Peptidase M23 n=1 Tax=Lacinutrix venerupis TaxID=1486034 RepID=A0AAC9LK20_9FLAO|nr:M23 family metallopeptidase [Lacinutrix venerupis]APY00091.1 peptidase M23 [Lacinutrix venerupis]
MRKLFLFFFISFSVFSQNQYPQDYFRSPLDINIVLAGTFAELRSNHFHSGLDIKTKQIEGLKVYGIADGYVSRIKIAHFGYGKALYITHPNGYTSVYAHLQKFSPKIEAYIKAKQYNKESFEIEVFPTNEELKITKGEVIAYSGNTGSSSGPHLHFEIRDNAERPINPMLFGIDVKDTTKPIVSNFYAYPIGANSHVNGSNKKQKLRVIPQKNGDYKIEDLKAYGTIGFAVETIDRQDLAANKNGVYNISTYLNGMQNFEIDFRRFSFAETKHLNRLIDYSHYKSEKQKLQKLFIEENNPLSLYNNIIDNGYITILDSTASVYKTKISDFKGNETNVDITIKGDVKIPDDVEEKKTTQHYIQHDLEAELQQDKFKVNFYKDTFYDSFFIDFNVKNDTLTLHKPIIPVKKSFTISYDISNFKEEDLKQLYIAELIGWNNWPSYSPTKRKGNTLSTYTKDLGTYVLARDTVAPTIKPINFKDGSWLSKYRYLKVKINDKGTGISNYRATINGKWILMEYNYKKKTLTYDFNDAVSTETKNKLKVIVTDNVGNSTTFETTFFRK